LRGHVKKKKKKKNAGKNGKKKSLSVDRPFDNKLHYIFWKLEYNPHVNQKKTYNPALIRKIYVYPLFYAFTFHHYFYLFQLVERDQQVS
jgi:hypothetical protein